MTHHRLPRLADSERSLIAALAGVGCGLALGAALRRERPQEAWPSYSQPNRHTTLAQPEGRPERRYYTGRNLDRAVAIADLRAMTHRFLPRFALEYLE